MRELAECSPPVTGRERRARRYEPCHRRPKRRLPHAETKRTQIRPCGSRAAALNAALRRGLVWTVVLCILGAVLGRARRAVVHRLVAKATILVNPLDGNPFSTKGSGDDLINLETEAQLVQSDDVARLVQKRERVPTLLPDILAGLQVSVPPNTQILDIEYSSNASEISRSRAQLFATEYLAYREQRAKSLVASQTKRLEEQLQARRKEQPTLARQLSDARPGSTQAGVLAGTARSGQYSDQPVRRPVGRASVGFLQSRASRDPRRHSSFRLAGLLDHLRVGRPFRPDFDCRSGRHSFGRGLTTGFAMSMTSPPRDRFCWVR